MVANAQTLKRHLSKEEKAKLIKQYVGKDFDLHGERFEILSKVLEYIDHGDHLMSSLEIGGDATATGLATVGGDVAATWLPRVAAILESGAFVAVGEILAVTSALVFPFSGIIELDKANHGSERVYGMRAVAYTTTAWAFDDPIPYNSPSRMHDLRQDYRFDSKLYIKNLSAFQKAWNNAQQATLLKLKKLGKIDKKAAQLMFRALGDGNRKKLTLYILKGFEEDSRGVEKVLIRYACKLLYPN